MINQRFGENDLNDDVYSKAAHDLVPLALGGGVGTLFAYGQVSFSFSFLMYTFSTTHKTYFFSDVIWENTYIGWY